MFQEFVVFSRFSNFFKKVKNVLTSGILNGTKTENDENSWPFWLKQNKERFTFPVNDTNEKQNSFLNFTSSITSFLRISDYERIWYASDLIIC